MPSMNQKLIQGSLSTKEGLNIKVSSDFTNLFKVKINDSEWQTFFEGRDERMRIEFIAQTEEELDGASQLEFVLPDGQTVCFKYIKIKNNE